MKHSMLSNMKILISLSILIKVCLCCSVRRYRPLEELLEENNNSPWLVLVTDVTSVRSHDHSLPGLCYGSIIHERLVMTSAYPLINTDSKNLEVLANCTAPNEDMVCVKRKVYGIFHPEELNEKEEPDINDWDILILTKPFDMSRRINIINLAGSNDKYDQNCQFYHWQIAAFYAIGEKGVDLLETAELVHYPYNVSFHSDEFEVPDDGEIKMQRDVDCVIQRCSESDEDKKRGLLKKLGFMGTPIVCQLEDETPVQIGFATIAYDILFENGVDEVRYRSGGFVKFLSDTDEFIRPFIGNVSQSEYND